MADPRRAPFAVVVRLWTARPETAYAEVDEDLEIVFGRIRFRTPVANIAGWRIEGPWRWITAIGVRRSVRHGDVSFAGDAHGGVRMDLREKVAWGPFHVPAVWVGADDLEGFADELTPAGDPGHRRTAAPPRIPPPLAVALARCGAAEAGRPGVRAQPRQSSARRARLLR